MAVAVLSVTASGCVTVHGEREILPSATKTEAARALKDFTVAYNKADKAADPALDAARVTGPFGAITQGGLRARHAAGQQGGSGHVPLELSDVSYAIHKQAGWPRWFVADTDSNRDADDNPQLDTRWFFVFTRTGPDQVWQAAYLSILSPGEVPKLSRDKDGWAEPVAPGAKDLATRPRKLSEEYAAYLKAGGGTVFADGQHTSDWVAQRKRNARLPGRTTQYVDQALDTGSFAPLGLRTEDGGALFFFATRHFEKQTAVKGVTPAVPREAKPLMKGEAKRSYTLERVSDAAVTVPPKGAKDPRVDFLNRLQGLTGAKGE
ncbi:hypothetical protein [Streptomyces tsukubensis]|uniref:DUF8094 domain-containing protein n=1 Tax=Streptomyces tsukubensis TaxID=83656 RepID=A0A1V3ZZW4_9ACTN|nr:hypothetical protein [Streptomyces tsukubensis]OON72083.1 hypothetical protein B1H18_31240 [Streptomyces tsukubensis]QFR97627.1 hypothetical protein GBW32_09475 [Streptomyces tsukubensis]